MLRIEEIQLALQVIGEEHGGRPHDPGELVFLRHGEVIARSRILTDANAAEMLPGDGLISSRLAFTSSAEGPE